MSLPVSPRSVLYAGLMAMLLTQFVGCGRKVDPSLVEEAASVFQSRADAADYALIYQEADASFQRAGTEEQFADYMKSLSEALGKLEERNLISSVEVQFPGEAQRRVIYRSRFAQGMAEERFTWVLRGQKLVLVGYSAAATTGQ